MEDSVITRLDKSTMVRMLRDEADFSELFTAHLLARTIRVEEDLVDQLFNSSEKRLARDSVTIQHRQSIIAAAARQRLRGTPSRAGMSSPPRTRRFPRICNILSRNG
jgi:hypothetical protein